MNGTPTTVVTDEGGNALMARLDGTAPAMEIAGDLARRAVWSLPVVMIFGAFWGLHGVASASYGLAVVVVNFLLAGWLLAVTGRISFALMAGAALFGYIVRLGIITAAVLLVRDASWVQVVPLGATLIVAHLGLLMWELRFVSGSYAHPGLKPRTRRYAAPTTDDDATDQSASAA